MIFLAAPLLDRIDAPRVIEWPINGDAFPTWVERVLVQTLRPSDIVILDKFGSDKSQASCAGIRLAGADLWYLPALQPTPELHRAGLRQVQKPVVQNRRRYQRSLVAALSEQNS